MMIILEMTLFVMASFGGLVGVSVAFQNLVDRRRKKQSDNLPVLKEYTKIE